MKVHHFVTEWFFQAPIDRVWEQIADVKSYPDKWPSWRRTVVRGSESKLQLGSVIDCYARGPIPYNARFTFEITALQPPTLMEYASSGDLVGKGSWVLEPQGHGIVVTSYWDVGISVAVFDFLTKLPFARVFVQKHHNYIMAQGYRGFKANLE